MIQTITTLKSITVPRAVYWTATCVKQRLFTFVGASNTAIAYVIYLWTLTSYNKVHIAFIVGNSWFIHSGAHFHSKLSIPTTELCTLDPLAQMVLQVQRDLEGEITLLTTQFFSYSKDVIAWLNIRRDSFRRYGTTKRDRIYQVSGSIPMALDSK